MRLEMEDWADGMLATLETNLDKFLVAVRRGRERLHERSQESVVAGIGRVDLNDNGSSYYNSPVARRLPASAGVRVRHARVVGLRVDRGAEADPPR